MNTLYEQLLLFPERAENLGFKEHIARSHRGLSQLVELSLLESV